MSEILEFFKKIKDLNEINISKYLLIKNLAYIVKIQVNEMFPILNNEEKQYMFNLALYLSYSIINKFLDIEDMNYLEQFTQNNFRDIKSIILMLIPFIDDKDNNKRLRTMQDLNQILYNKIGKKSIDNYIGKKNIVDALRDEFYYSNFSIGLLNKMENYLQLINMNNDKLIHDIIYHNYISLLETLKICNGKLYINWMNIEPIMETNLTNEKIYINTKERAIEYNTLIQTENVNNIKEFENNYNGLYLGDFYNVMRKGYYQSVKKVKWLIFNRFIRSKRKNKYYIAILDDIFDLTNHLDKNLNFYSYNDIPELDQYDFIKRLKAFLLKIKSDDVYLDVAKQLSIYIVNNYKYKNKINNEIIKDSREKLKFKTDIYNDFEETSNDDLNRENKEKFDEIKTKDIINFLSNIDIEHIWDYIKEALDLFQSSIYSTFIISDNFTIDHSFFLINNDTNKINLKNLYNIAKLLSHNKIPWKLLPESYQSLTWEQKKTFINKFFTNDWIKINRNLELETANSKKTVEKRDKEIKSDWIVNNVDFIFKYLIRRGILSKMVPDYKVTNKNNLPSGHSAGNKQIEKHMKSKFKKNSHWNDSYYYLTNQKFSKLDLMRSEHPLLKIKEETYFDRIARDQKWFKFYAMDWLTQINFFHTYINHAVMYVTGSTGQGKTTQVPKLLMYALKMIDFKENGKVICTQPRVPPTTNNAERISEELGVPIIQPSKTVNSKVSTQNFYCMYKYQGGKHMTNSNKHLSLKVVTDGTLFEEMKTNPIMKEKVIGKSNNMKEFTFSEKNTYDVIIVDEAHEHNPNMDLILTLARNACYFNNSIRLIIVSATMDDDEPIYRYYFKMINDNLVYPIKQPIKYHPFINKEDFLPQTIYMDRRFHISPPGEGTQYIITENYVGLNETEDNKKNSQLGQLQSYKVVQEICNKSDKGEILLFSTGENEIKDAVKYLNEHLTGGNVALPYFGTMNKKYKDIIEKIDKNIHKIKNDKQDIYKIWGPTFIEDSSVPDGIYKRAIIVATNVAEASVTIPRLEYVVDNGYSKEATYNEMSDSIELNVEMISEASRVQRKGRVGRISDGTVYYMYNKGARQYVKPKYKITQMDMGLVFNNLATRETFEQEQIKFKKIYLSSFTENDMFYDPHFFEFKDVYNSNLTNYKKFDFHKLGVYDMINRQFTLNNQPLSEQYFLKEYHSKDSMNIMIDVIETYIDGNPLSINSVLDLFGRFYIIHPKENIIIRNSLGEIIERKVDDNKNKIKMNQFKLKDYRMTIDRLQSKFSILNINSSENDQTEISKLNFRKTLISEKINELISKTDVGKSATNQFELALTLMNAYGHSEEDMEIIDDVIMIISILEVISYSMINLPSKYINQFGKEVSHFDELKSIINSNRSDIEVLYKIVRRIKIILNKSTLCKLNILKAKSLESRKIDSEFKEKYRKIIQTYKNAIKVNNIDPPVKLSKDWDKMNELKNEGKLNNNGFESWLDNSIDIEEQVFNDLNLYMSELKNFCNVNYLDFKIINSSLKKYFKFKKSFKTIDKDVDSKNKPKNVLQWIDTIKHNFTSKFGEMTKTDKIINSFIAGFSTNILFKTDLYNEYYKMGSLDSNGNMTQINLHSLFWKKNEVASMTKRQSHNLMFISKNMLGNAEIFTNVNVKELVLNNPLYYNPKDFKNIYTYINFNSNKKNLVEMKGPLWETFKINLYNNWNMVKIVWESDKDSNLNDENYDINLNTYLKNLRRLVITYRK